MVKLLPMNIIFIALAPVFIIALYIYFRDKYEKEPIKMLLTALLVGCLIVIPVSFVERFLAHLHPLLPRGGKAIYRAFFVAGFTEEGFKFLALFLLIWRNRNFNEKFDGIVYAVFIGLGFAAVENIMYVTKLGVNVGWIRALTAVPAHALFGITMGYYFGLAKFYPDSRSLLLARSIFYPMMLHGIYDFILMLGDYRLLLGFIPYVVFLYIDGLKRMKNLSDRSIFRN